MHINYMITVHDFLLGFSGSQYELLRMLHEMILSYPGIEEKIRYKIPFYYRKSWICYLNPIKTGGVELAFTRANELENVSDFLNFEGRKQVAGIFYNHPKEINEEIFRFVMTEAHNLDDAIPYNVKKKKIR